MNTLLKHTALACAAALALSACTVLDAIDNAIEGRPNIRHEAVLVSSEGGVDTYRGSKEPPASPRVVEGAGSVYECRNHRCGKIR